MSLDSPPPCATKHSHARSMSTMPRESEHQPRLIGYPIRVQHACSKRRTRSCVVSFSPLATSIWCPFRCQSEWPPTGRLAEARPRVYGRRYRSIPQYGLGISANGVAYFLRESQYQRIANTIVQLIRQNTSRLIFPLEPSVRVGTPGKRDWVIMDELRDVLTRLQQRGAGGLREASREFPPETLQWCGSPSRA